MELLPDSTGNFSMPEGQAAVAEPQPRTETPQHPTQVRPPAVQPAPAPAVQPRPQTEPSLRPEDLVREVEIGLVAGKREIGRTDSQGREIESVEIAEANSREFGMHQAAEYREKWSGRFAFLRQAIPRMWKTGIGEIGTYGRDKSRGVAMWAEAGFQFQTVDNDFYNAIDKAARANVQGGRRGLGRAAGRIRDVANEAVFRQTDVHREQVALLRQLRQAVENPSDPASQQFLQDQNNAQLIADYRQHTQADYDAGSALARKITHEHADEILRGTIGEKRAGHAVDLTQPEHRVINEFFKRQVVEKLLTEGLRNGGTVPESVLAGVHGQIREFFSSEQFHQWRENLPSEVRDNLDLSLSYGTDIASFVQETMLPQAMQVREYQEDAARVTDYVDEVVLKLRVGTVKAGPEGRVQEGVLERAGARRIDQQRVLELIRNRGAFTDRSNVTTNATANRATLLGRAGRVASHHLLMATAAGAGIYVGQRLAGMGGNLVAPVIGGAVVGGVLRGAQEHRLFTKEFQQHSIESARGYTFAPDAKRRQGMAKLEYHKRGMQNELIAPMTQTLREIQQGADIDKDKAMKLMGLVADTKARISLMEQRGIDLLYSQNPSSYDAERSELWIRQAEAMHALSDYFGTHQQQLTEVQNDLQLQNVPAGVDAFGYAMSELVNAQQDHLLQGTGVSADLQAALGNLSIQQAESASAREAAFRSARNRRVLTSAAMTAGGALGGYLVSREAINAAGRLVAENNVGGLGQWFEDRGWAGRRPGSFMGVDMKDMYDNPRRISLGNSMELDVSQTSVDGGKQVFLERVDPAGRRLRVSGPPMWLHEGTDGRMRVIVAGASDNLPPQLQGVIGGWDSQRTPVHDMFAYTQQLAKGGVPNIPDQVIGTGGTDKDFGSSFLVNTHDIHQSSHLNPQNLTYDQWARVEARMDIGTGQIELGKMSLTGPDGTMLHGFARGDGRYAIDLTHYGNADLAKNPAKLQAMLAQMKIEGWGVVQDGVRPNIYNLTPPVATEYTPPLGFTFFGTDAGIPILLPRRPLERPEGVHGPYTPEPPIRPPQPEPEPPPEPIPPAPPVVEPPPAPPPAPRPPTEEGEASEPGTVTPSVFQPASTGEGEESQQAAPSEVSPSQEEAIRQQLRQAIEGLAVEDSRKQEIRSVIDAEVLSNVRTALSEGRITGDEIASVVLPTLQYAADKNPQQIRQQGAVSSEAIHELIADDARLLGTDTEQLLAGVLANTPDLLSRLQNVDAHKRRQILWLIMKSVEAGAIRGRST